MVNKKAIVVGDKVIIDEILYSINSEDYDIDIYYWGIAGYEELMNNVCWDEYICLVTAFEYEKLNVDFIDTVRRILNIKDLPVINYLAWKQAILPQKRADLVMKKPSINKYKGMVLGISHAEVGILEKEFCENTCNIAISSQDIYYNFRALQHCINKYWNKIENLEYIIIDLFDYNYFNFDTSISAHACDYYAQGGIIDDEHNFSHNSRFNLSFSYLQDYLLQDKYKGINVNDVDIWEDLFGDVYAYSDYKDFEPFAMKYRRFRIISEKELDEYEVKSSCVTNRYQNTIDENKNCLRQMLELIYEKWPRISVYMVLCPIPTRIQEKRKTLYQEWKKEFEEIICKLKQEYSFTYKSYLDDRICDKLEYFYDSEHLNSFGAHEFTQLLKQDFSI